MKRQLMRVSALLLAVMMVILAGCGGGKKNKTLSGAVSDTLAIEKATFEGEIELDIPVDTAGIKGITFTGTIDRSDYDFSVELSLKKDKNSASASYGINAVLQEILAGKGSLCTITKADGYLYIDFSSIVKSFGGDLADMLFSLYFASQGDDYEEAAEVIKDAKLDNVDRIIALITFVSGYYYDMEEVLEEMEDYEDEVDEMRDMIAEIEKAAGIKLDDLLKTTGFKFEIGAFSKEVKEAISSIEKILVELVKTAEEADKEFVTADTKAGSYEWQLDNKNVEDILEPVFDVLIDKVDDIWEAYTTIADWSVNESALPGHVQKVLEKIDEYLDYGLADNFEDELDDIYDQMTDKSNKKSLKSAFEDAQDGLGDMADSMKDAKATISGTYTLTGGKGKRVATCEIEIKSKGDDAGNISMSFTLTENSSAKVEEPGSALDVFNLIEKADIEEIIDIIDEYR